MFHILVFQQNSIKAHQNLHMNVANCLQRERRAKQCEQPSLRNNTLQLFRDEDVSALRRWDCGEMDTICGFCSAKMWIKERLAKSRNNNPQFSLCCENGKILLPNLLATPHDYVLIRGIFYVSTHTLAYIPIVCARDRAQRERERERYIYIYIYIYIY